MPYDHLFRPLKVGPLTVKNRIEVSPAEPFLCTRDGLVTDEFVAFTAAFARGGAGIVTVGDSPVTQQYADENHYVVNLADPFVVHGLFKLTDAIHRYGAIASIELNLRTHVFPADMTKDEIRGIIQAFTDAAGRCKKGGFDMIMLHGGHGHTVAQFYSPLMNKRTDAYGCGTFENRCRFANELLDSVRGAIGPDMAIEWRMSGDELTDGGVGLEDAVRFARAIQNKIDLVHISAGNMYNPASLSYAMQPTYLPLATNVRFAERFKRELDIPVTSVGSFNLDLAEEAVAAGRADMIAMIRQFITDPDCAAKAKHGRGEDIRPCIRCMICTGDDPHGCPKPLRCTVNPVAGRNPLFDNMTKSPAPKKVVIIGGGAAGMEAARRCAERGHRVVLFEKAPALGGTLTAAGANRLKGDVRRYAEWSVRTTERTPGLDIRKSTAATRALVESEKPDAVIVAVGSTPFVPNIPGIKGSNVCLAVDVDLGRAAVGKRVVLIGAGLTGTETAVVLAQDGHEVTLIDMLPLSEIDSRGGASSNVAAFLRRMSDEAGVKVITGLRAKEITKDAVVAEDMDGGRVTLPCDSVVLSMGVRPREDLIREFDGCADDVMVVGDCAAQAGNITSAVRDGFYAAMNIG
ncbi:2,4-dienoyl-CoA reductase [Sporobacter termitidis DSM 10068]|uniref:2,4-dienoyl-CoA reductase n=1 Tax=Sporobacter termitidis DSM 10068 TaxID=1123282 RepID=A0A1M5Y8Z7_9FIRM|nr:FAD-dependent oxidoreductase [Sporobacter termitidis]SHI07983.1 2,4-dienoyl-CoA reductase [Sporobacter termitidis DSM 10068]